YAERALNILASPRNAADVVWAQIHIAGIYVELGDLGAAAAGYQDAVRASDEAALSYYGDFARALLACVQAENRDLKRAESTFDEAEAAIRHRDDANMISALAIHRGRLDVARSHALLAEGNARGSQTHRQRAEEILKGAVTPNPRAGEAWLNNANRSE